MVARVPGHRYAWLPIDRPPGRDCHFRAPIPAVRQTDFLQTKFNGLVIPASS
ncbi:hypothetical protein NicSoilB4_20910 [Arthrobacter sp. NicSoilB4]|nr:hypothetical protein NicSoilB4_20910 [Arthrobacter sp. NicSoilB4]